MLEQELSLVRDQMGRGLDVGAVQHFGEAVADIHVAVGQAFEQRPEIFIGGHSKFFAVAAAFDSLIGCGATEFGNHLVQPFDDRGAVVGAVQENLGELLVVDLRGDIAIEMLGLVRPAAHLPHQFRVIPCRHRLYSRSRIVDAAIRRAKTAHCNHNPKEWVRVSSPDTKT